MQQTMIPPMTLTVLSTAVTIVSVGDSVLNIGRNGKKLDGMPGTSVYSPEEDLPNLWGITWD